MGGGGCGVHHALSPTSSRPVFLTGGIGVSGDLE